MHAVIPYGIAALLFGLGVYGVLRRRNAILVLMAVELMLNAVNLILVAADATMKSTLVGVRPEAWAHPVPEPRAGAVFALFVIVLAAAEVGVGLAIVLQFYRLRRGVVLDEVVLHELDHEHNHETDNEYDHEYDHDTDRSETGQVTG
jgi:NADH-quinone oxidoreductase subunit K